MQKGIVRDCITMCFDICTINIRVSIRVRGLHLVLLWINPQLGSTPFRLPSWFLFAPGESARWQRHGADHHYGRSKDGALGGGPWSSF